MSSWQWRNCVRRGIKMESPKTWATETIDFEWNVKNFNWNLPLENLLGNDRLYEHRRPSRCCSSLLCHAPSSVHRIWKRFKDTRKFPLFFLSYNSLSLVGDFKFTMRKFVKSMGESEEWDGTEVDGNFLFCLLFIFTLLVNEDLMPMTQKRRCLVVMRRHSQQNKLRNISTNFDRRQWQGKRGAVVRTVNKKGRKFRFEYKETLVSSTSQLFPHFPYGNGQWHFTFIHDKFNDLECVVSPLLRLWPVNSFLLFFVSAGGKCTGILFLGV